ncbi:MAG: 3-oxoacyl-ACP synthase, partial [Armatimonadetes bacterium]|nr:3-oxoacyl-ACP synthase [Akkermansiaceae bacterium]
YSTSGNTVSNTIPIALHHAVKEGKIQLGDTLMLVGFGVGLSWGACLARF